jgi:hypothetical protein
MCLDADDRAGAIERNTNSGEVTEQAPSGGTSNAEDKSTAEDAPQNPHLRFFIVSGIGLILILVWAVLPGGTRAQPGFYEAAAQIIPVLILALAVERLWSRWTLPYRTIVLVPLVAGEIAALSAAALATPRGKSGERLVACSAKVAESRDSTRCAQVLTDVLGALTAFGLFIGLVAVLLNTLAVRPPAGHTDLASGDVRQVAT